MVPIEGGTFEMGTDSAEIPVLAARYGVSRAAIFAPEVPKRRVRVAPFLMDRFEVTNAEFASFLERQPEWRPDRIPARYHNGDYLRHWTAGLYPTGQSDHPVTYVPWYAARAFCQSAGRRLPTEAEWEYAARGGERGDVFPWGEAPPDSSRANWSGAGHEGTTPVGRYPANPFGLHDMAGNVWEYTADEWPDGSDGTIRYAIRGGSWGAAAVNLRVRYRDSHPATDAGPHVGFRCARGGAGDDRPGRR
jgi:formylglycine-generating enzyme required for sulfatase activity